MFCSNRVSSPSSHRLAGQVCKVCTDFFGRTSFKQYYIQNAGKERALSRRNPRNHFPARCGIRRFYSKTLRNRNIAVVQNLEECRKGKGSSSRSSTSKSRRSGRRQGPCCGAVFPGDLAWQNGSDSRGARNPFRRCGRSGRTTRRSPKKAFSTPSKKAATLFERRPTSLFLLAMPQRPPPVASSKLSCLLAVFGVLLGWVTVLLETHAHRSLQERISPVCPRQRKRSRRSQWAPRKLALGAPPGKRQTRARGTSPAQHAC